MVIRVTKEFHFEMAHALVGHDGPCKNIHGHSYSLYVTLKNTLIKDPKNPKAGMVMDFSDMKNLVKEAVVDEFDHALVLHDKTAHMVYAGKKNEKLLLVDFTPTCENLTIHFAKKLLKVFPEGTLHHILLRETRTAYAEWFAEDNLPNVG